MPKVYLSEQQKLNNRLASWVYGELKIQGKTQKDLADEMGITQPAVSYKLRTKCFTFEDICCFVRMFQPDKDEVTRLLGM